MYNILNYKTNEVLNTRRKLYKEIGANKEEVKVQKE